MKNRAMLALGLLWCAACGSEPAAPAADAGPADPDLRPDRRLDLPAPDLVEDLPSPDMASGPQLLAGAAVVDITPSVADGVPLAGYGGGARRKWTLTTIPATVAAVVGACVDPSPGSAASLFEPAAGVHDPVTARALVLDNGATKAAMVKVDTIGLSRPFFDDLAQAAQPLGIPKQNLFIAATHTHSGPGAATKNKLLQIAAADCYSQPTYKDMMAGITAALTQANAALRPARFGAGSVQESRVSRNRSGRPGIRDTELGLIKLVDLHGGAPIAAVLSFAVHGTCLDAGNMLFSADLPGQAESAVERLLGGGVGLFLNGAEGDVKPTQPGFGGAQVLGEYLAKSATQLWSTLPTKPWIEIHGSFADEATPPPSFQGCLPLLGDSSTLCDYLPGVQIPIGQWMPKVLPFSALRLDDVALATVPGEPITEIGWEIKKAGTEAGHRMTLVVGLANDYMGYVATQAEYGRAEYEGQYTLYGPGTGAFVVGAAARQLDAVKVKAAP